jgi:predicted DNA-binding transcriptional regulator YafY
MAVDKIKRQNLTLSFLHTGPKTFKEIVVFYKKLWELQDFEINTSLRTFQRDIKDIQSRYGVEIIFDTALEKYSIKNDHIIRDSVLIDSVALYEILQLSGKIRDFVFNEKRHVSGVTFIVDILAAIKLSKTIEVEHTKFDDSKSTIRKIEPYGVKEFRYRWYLIGKDLGDKKIKAFGLERVQRINEIDRLYTMPKGFNMEKYFEYSYGVMGGGLKPEEIILSFNPSQRGYLQTLPFHHTQEVLIDNEEEYLIKLKLAITKDFVMDLLERTPDFKVVKPKSLVDEIVTFYQASLSKYL